MKPGVCYLIGAGEHYNNTKPCPDSDDYVIAVDGGYDYCINNNIPPDLILGDFDSSSYGKPETDNVHIKSFPPAKDFTDMALAAKEALGRGYRTILIYGGTGGRSDHTFSNIQLLSYIADNKATAYLFDNEYTTTVITNSVLNICKDRTDKYNGFLISSGYGYISVFSLSDVSEGVTIKGLKYTTDNITLDRLNPIGTSNEYTNSDCSIEVTNGSLLIMSQIH